VEHWELHGFDIPYAILWATFWQARKRESRCKAALTAVGVWKMLLPQRSCVSLGRCRRGLLIEGEGPALGAIEAAKERGAGRTGYVGDMSETWSYRVLTSIVSAEPLFEDMMKKTMDKSF
jgi:hypothetical protein